MAKKSKNQRHRRKAELIELTEKQEHYLDYSTTKYNIFGGATGSGKTFLSKFIIPMRILECTGAGDIAIIGNTQGTVVRNVIDPLRDFYGEALVGNVTGKNTCKMFGVNVHIFGADKVSHKTKIQGLNLEYVYADEIVTWNREFWMMLATRLRKRYSKLDGTCNPDGPKHWFKVWMDELNEKNDKAGKPRQIFYLNTTIDDAKLDNDPEENARLIQEQKDSMSGVFYQRFMRGKWAKADGLIYEKFAKAPEMADVTLDMLPKLDKISIGVDFGGNKSKHAFVATGLDAANKCLYVLRSKSIKPQGLGPEDLAAEYVKFLIEVENDFGVVAGYTYADSAEQVLITGMRGALNRAGLNRTIWNAQKSPIINRVRATDLLLNKGKLRILKEDKGVSGNEGAKTVKDALLEAVWDGKKDTQERLDDGSTDVDTLDAFEYTFERDIHFLLGGII